MGKTLAVILNHNRREYTDRVYRMVAPYAKDQYDVVVLDNGSTDTSEVSQYTMYQSETNCYFGGGFNLAMQLMQQNEQYDSMLFMSNDIILHGYNYISKLRSIMFDEDYAVVASSVTQPEEGQCFWKQMHNWGASKTRTVKWVDFMCPLIRRDVLDTIGQYDMDLVYGWGLDIYTGVVCEDKGWKTGVTDTLSLIHFSAQTVKDNKANLTMSDYARNAESGMYGFFGKINRMNDLERMRHFGMTYQYTGSI
jgi:GT2 family glycosyltransferase